MFVRFQQQGNRLQPSLMQSRRVDGKPRSEHIASLGSVDADLSLRGRLAFWAELPSRLSRLANRVGPEDHDKIIGALHARIPVVTVAEQQQIKKENAEEDERFWTDMRDKNASLVEGHKGVVALAERKIAEIAPQVETAAANAEAAKSRVKKIEQGEDVEGGLFQKPFDAEALLKEWGWTPRELKRLRLQGNLTEPEFEWMMKNIIDKTIEAGDREWDRWIRRIILVRGRITLPDGT
jgi:hypothetical protein